MWKSAGARIAVRRRGFSVPLKWAAVLPLALVGGALVLDRFGNQSRQESSSSDFETSDRPAEVWQSPTDVLMTSSASDFSTRWGEVDYWESLTRLPGDPSPSATWEVPTDFLLRWAGPPVATQEAEGRFKSQPKT